MPYDDDTDVTVSKSSSEYFVSPAQAERNVLKQKLQKDGLVHKSDQLVDLKKSVLKAQLAGKKDEEQKRNDKKNEKNEKKTSSIGTKTREQEIAERTLTADTQPTTDGIVKQDVSDKKAEEELKAQEGATEEA